jgi:hypothetical protein
MAPLTIHIKKKEERKKKQFLEKDFLTNATAGARKTGNGTLQTSMTARAGIPIFSVWDPQKTCRAKEPCLHQHARDVTAEFMLHISAHFLIYVRQ